MSQSTKTGDPGGATLSDVLGVVTDGQTYRNLLYLSLAFPLGLVHYIVLVVGFSLGIGLAVLGVGVLILAGTLVGVRFIASLERSLANRLLGTSITRPTDVHGEGNGILARAKAFLGASSTWRALGFVFLKFWIGILSFVLLVSFLGTAVELLVMPLYPSGVLNVQVLGWETADTFGTSLGRAVAVPTGAILAVVALHVLNAFAETNATIASSLLGPEESNSVERPPEATN